MAYTKIKAVDSRLDRCLDYVQNHEKTSLANTLHYAMNGDKTEGGYFESAINCELERAYADMIATKRRWGKYGKNRVQGYHVIQSFAPGEATPEEAHTMGIEFVQNLLGDRYEAIVTTHLDREHLHNHVVFNSVSFMDGICIKTTASAICQALHPSKVQLRNAEKEQSVPSGMGPKVTWSK